jgi:outer membrane protein OmpA-like peptidoglycan-associated protein
VLKSHRDLNLEIQGHTGTSGNAAAHLKLSEERANTARRAYERVWCVEEQIAAEACGSGSSERTVEGQANSHRMELVRH